MKFMLNGALTIGTLDGANVEMAEAVGKENIFIFGLKTNEVQALWQRGYSPSEFIERSPALKEIFHLLRSNFFSPSDPGLFNPIIQSLTEHDPFLVCADFESYRQMQEVVAQNYQDKTGWTKKSILNVAKSGKFSSDRTIREYAKEIWKVPVAGL